ncbi:MAG: aspartate carbamoyltransferase catalytic subunit [Pseudomonadota bacterium]
MSKPTAQPVITHRTPAGHRFNHPHLLSIEGLSREDILFLLDRGEAAVRLSREQRKREPVLKGRTQINLFFEASTRTQGSFEIAGKRLGADVVNMAVAHSSVSKGESLLDTIGTLHAMQPDLLCVRHNHAGAIGLIARKVNCAVINAGDGQHEHPTQALLDALTIRRHKGDINELTVAICGDVLHSRVARSNIITLGQLGAKIRLVGPSTLMPSGVSEMGVDVFSDMAAGLEDADVVMMLRVQRERMEGSFVPSEREYFHFFGLTRERLRAAKPDALVMHPGPMNRGVEIASDVADGPQSVISEQVEMGVAVRIAVMQTLIEVQDRGASATIQKAVGGLA